MEQVSYLFLIPLFPLLGAAYNGMFGAKLHKRFGEAAVHWPSVLLPWGSFLVALWAFVNLAGLEEEHVLYQRLWAWLPVLIFLPVAFVEFDSMKT